MYTLIIKGDEAAAFAACREHKVEITSIVRHEKFNECIVTIPDGLPTHDALTAWFCEYNELDDANPNPPGTLLWYGQRTSLPVANPLMQGWSSTEEHPTPAGSKKAFAEVLWIDLNKEGE